MPPELRTSSLPPPPSLSITRRHLHPDPLSIILGPSIQNLYVISSETFTLIRLSSTPPNLNDTLWTTPLICCSARE